MTQITQVPITPFQQGRIHDGNGDGIGWRPVNIASAVTTNVKDGSGVLHSIVINTPVAEGTITIYNNTAASGTKIGTITLPATLVSQGPMTAIYDAAFSIGLTIVTVGVSDITVTYV